MSAGPATTLGRRTSAANIAWNTYRVGYPGPVRPNLRRVRIARNAGPPLPRCRSARPPPTLAPLSPRGRRSHHAVRRGARPAGHADTRRTGIGGDLPVGRRGRGRSLGRRAPSGRWPRSRHCCGRSTAPRPIAAGHPLVARAGRLASRGPDPADRCRARVAGPGDPRAEGDRRGGASRVARAHPRATASRRPGPPEWACACRRARDPGGAPLLRVPPVRRGAASGRGDPARRRRAAWFEAIVDLPLPEAYARLHGRSRGSARGPRPRSASARSATRTP